jgi:ferrous iron transport protein A
MSHRDEPFVTRPLSESVRGSSGVVARVEYRSPTDPIAERLEALGFVPGEPVRVVATGPLGGEPIVVLIGSTRFALRHAEAARVLLHATSGAGHD